MPSNPHKITQQARSELNNILKRVKQPINIKELCLEILIRYEVSDSWPEKFIKKYYVGRIVNLEEDILTPIEEEKNGSI